ncbi:MAG: extracellular solute-binding protein [Clostridia bacterium]|nr:extracellular solute-binding protein [Clostridia bacterium]
MRKAMQRSFAMLLALTVLMTCLSGMSVFAARDINFEGLDFDYNREHTYYNYKAQYKDLSAKPGVYFDAPAAEFSAADEANVSIQEDGSVLFAENATWVEYTVNMEEEGLYGIEVAVCATEDTTNEMEFGFEINGETPFNEAETIKVYRGVKDEAEDLEENGDFKLDRGNDVRPTQVVSYEPRVMKAVDPQGLELEPFQFYFAAGENTLRLVTHGGSFRLLNVRVCNDEPIRPYKDVKAEYDALGYKEASEPIKFQAEKAFEKSNSVLAPTFARGNPMLEPTSPSKTKLNIIGSANWSEAGQWISWKADVEEAGLYALGFKYQQNALQGMFCTRTIYVDGVIPFEEFKAVEFPYTEEYINLVPSDAEGNPCLIYLSEGTHEIKLEVSLGRTASILNELNEVVYALNDIYKKIVMIASTSPDPYQDYNFEKVIPTLEDTLEESIDILNAQAQALREITGAGGSQSASLENYAQNFGRLLEDPERFNTGLSSFKDDVSAMSQWIIDTQSQPISLDWITLHPTSYELPETRASFFTDFAFKFKSFISSFTEDYDVIASVEDANVRSVRVWVGTGRDQANIISNLINDEFIPATGINIQLELVQGSLIEATLAGKGPDVALMIAQDQPINFAIRGALADLSQFEGFDEVTKRYSPETMNPYTFQKYDEEGYPIYDENGKPVEAVYAIPETETFNMMFYRKDVFAELGINVPETWDEFFAILPVLNRNNLEAGVVDQVMYQLMLYQAGGQYYADDKRSTEFDTEVSLEAFKKTVECFTKYSFPISYNFYTRFRSGEMPISIQPYTQYNMIAAAAPEIQGLWDMAPIPGTLREDGTIDRTQLGTVAGTIMFENTKDKEAAWEFIKWYTSAEVQTRYGLELEAVQGAAGRYAPANLAAFENMNWSYEQRAQLQEQWKFVSVVPELPGSYYTARGLTNAFRTAIYEFKNPYATLTTWAKNMDEEIERKYEEFGFR